MYCPRIFNVVKPTIFKKYHKIFGISKNNYYLYTMKFLILYTFLQLNYVKDCNCSKLEQKTIVIDNISNILTIRNVTPLKTELIYCTTCQ